MGSFSLSRGVGASYKGRTWIGAKVDIMLVEGKYSGMSMPFGDDSGMPNSVLKVCFVLNCKMLH